MKRKTPHPYVRTLLREALDFALIVTVLALAALAFRHADTLEAVALCLFQ